MSERERDSMSGTKAALGDRVRRWLVSKGLAARKSYSQCGEDLLIAFLFEMLGVQKPSYMDIGAHDPNYLNNTKIFYDRGSTGINIEANPTLIRRFERLRPRDVNLNVGVVDESSGASTLDFYVMSMSTMSTFSKEEAQRLIRETSLKIERVIPVATKGLAQIVRDRSQGTCPELLCVDIEGLDAVLIPSIASFEQKKRPSVICIETLTYSESARPERKRHDLIEAVERVGYAVYADTFINTIFCREDLGIV
jgi:Methyltransferase FkbM domain